METITNIRKWVKVVGSDFRLEYPQKRVNHADGYYYHFEDDKSQEPKKIRITGTFLEDNGDGSYTGWSFGLWGPVGERGVLLPEIKVITELNKYDLAAIQNIENLMKRSLTSQQAMFTILKLQQTPLATASVQRH